MFKKNDLIKRFEETTKQEIINHNKAISGTNSSIVSIRQDMQSLRKLFQDHVKGYMSFISDQRSKEQESMIFYSTEIHSVDSKANDAINICKAASDAHNKLNQQVLNLSSTVIDVSGKVALIWNEIRNIDEYTESIKSDFFNELERLKHVFNDRHEKFIQEVSLKPKELDLLDDSLSYKIDEIRTNQTCTHDELEIVKKDVKYMQKQIEYLISHVKGLQ